MKKRIIRIVLAAVAVVLVAIVGYCIYMETHFTTREFVQTKQTPAQILKEMPDIAFTEEDEAMYQALMADPAITEAFSLAEESEKAYYEFPLDEAEALLRDWIPEGSAPFSLSVTDSQIVYVDFWSDDTPHISYSFNSNFDTKLKIICIYEKDRYGEQSLEAMYINDNGEITKEKARHVWFAWIEMTRG